MWNRVDWHGLFGRRMQQAFAQAAFYQSDPEYAALCGHNRYMRSLKWTKEPFDEDGNYVESDEERLSKLEARMFRLHATLGRLLNDTRAR